MENPESHGAGILISGKSIVLKLMLCCIYKRFNHFLLFIGQS